MAAGVSDGTGGASATSGSRAAGLAGGTSAARGVSAGAGADSGSRRTTPCLQGLPRSPGKAQGSSRGILPGERAENHVVLHPGPGFFSGAGAIVWQHVLNHAQRRDARLEQASDVSPEGAQPVQLALGVCKAGFQQQVCPFFGVADDLSRLPLGFGTNRVRLLADVRERWPRAGALCGAGIPIGSSGCPSRVPRGATWNMTRLL